MLYLPLATVVYYSVPIVGFHGSNSRSTIPYHIIMDTNYWTVPLYCNLKTVLSPTQLMLIVMECCTVIQAQIKSFTL